MTEEQLKALLDNHIDDSQSAYQDVDTDIQKATDYYLGKSMVMKSKVSLV